jgi:hypothetical protein
MKKFLIFFFMLGILLSLNCAKAKQSLVAYYNFDENSGNIAYDYSGNNNNGILYNVAWVDGKYNKGIKLLDDNSYVLIKDSSSLDFDKSEGTIEIWLYPFNKSSGKYQRLVMDSNWNFGSSPGGIELGIQPDGDLYFYPSKGGGNNYNLVTNPLINNQWQHLAVTWKYSTKEVLIYINGIKQSFSVENVPSNWDVLAQTGDWQIGGANISLTERYFNGIIDELKIYDYALNENQIKSHYENKMILYGQLKDKNNNPIQASISINSYSNNTDPKGNYFLQMVPGTYDINYSLQSFWVKINSFALNSDKKDLVNYITKYDNKVSFTLDITKEQVIQVHSPNKPKRILINGTEITEVNSLPDLKNNTWFYNLTEKKLYTKTVLDCSLQCKAKGYASGVCRSGETSPVGSFGINVQWYSDAETSTYYPDLWTLVDYIGATHIWSAPRRNWIDEAAAHGKKVVIGFGICWSPENCMDAYKSKENLIAHLSRYNISQYRNHPAVWGYEIVGEPYDDDNLREIIRAGIQYIKSIDPTHPVTIKLDPKPYYYYDPEGKWVENRKNTILKWIDMVDVLTYDLYLNGDAGTEFWRNPELMRSRLVTMLDQVLIPASKGKPIIIGETGCPSPYYKDWKGQYANYTEEQQAEYFRIYGEETKKRGIFVYAFYLIDNPYWEEKWGLFKSDKGTTMNIPKLAASKVKDYLSLSPSATGCQSGETSIGQDGCSSGETCCCWESELGVWDVYSTTYIPEQATWGVVKDPKSMPSSANIKNGLIMDWYDLHPPWTSSGINAFKTAADLRNIEDQLKTLDTSHL